jgi:hypothetical protein
MSGFDGTGDFISIYLQVQVTRDTLMFGLKMDHPISGNRVITHDRRRGRGRVMLSKNGDW